jgi:hypothetical protein
MDNRRKPAAFIIVGGFILVAILWVTYTAYNVHRVSAVVSDCARSSEHDGSAPNSYAKCMDAHGLHATILPKEQGSIVVRRSHRGRLHHEM